MSNWLKAIAFLIGSAILTRLIPFSSFFRNVDTMVHEFGHAIVTLMLSGRVMNISLYPDHSGVTRSLVANGFRMVPVALAGYVIASLFAWLLFSLYARGKYTAGLGIITAIAAVSLLLFVRNSFGVTWLIGFLVLTIVVFLLPAAVQKYYFLLIAFLSLEESAMGPVTLILYSLQAPSRAGDAAILADVTPLPAIAWSVIMLIIALWCAKNAILAFVSRDRYRQPKPALSSEGRPGRGA
ncbi:M50 family metallopeptidase [Gorillibacterium massiliense]|uniref:M50 family metallopeptidase n=1 Tax=Gorillibacterium massiliense TaxID=1280390 RepID=UPI0004B23C40|nr:M50 family metallopeptidase [Gorillibacterium massiliense]